MATICAGVKRSFHEMQTQHTTARVTSHSGGVSQFANTSNTSNTSRESSASPLRNGIHSGSSKLTSRSRKALFRPDASLLLVGVRGVGKSSLGFLAASAYSRRLIESDRAFVDATGATRPQYRKTHGTAEYHRKHCEVFKALISQYSTNAIIICNFADLESDGARLLQEFAQSHPVIYVTRDIPGIQNYIRIWSEERIQDLVRASEPLLRDCSNFEFFNISETLEENAETNSTSPFSRSANGPFLTLKRTEHDFLKLVRNILGDHARARSHQSAYPLSQISIEALEFTSAVVMTVEDILNHHLDLEEAQIGVDAIQLDISCDLNGSKYGTPSKHACFNAISEAFAILRRSTILPIILATRGRSIDQDHMKSADMLEYCFRLGPEYCTLDMELDKIHTDHLLLSKGRTKVIGEFCDVKQLLDGWQGEEVLKFYHRARQQGCDLVKITMPYNSFEDNLAVQAFQQRIRVLRSDGAPGLIAYCTGRQGRTSMCFNQILTPVRPSNALITSENANTQSSITARQRNEALFSSFVHEPMKFFIYGANVSFSLSPAMHNAAYEACGMQHAYRTHSASTLDELSSLVRDESFGGAAIVQPFKTKTISMMNVLSPQAKAIGAINTIIPLRNESAVPTALNGHGIFWERNRTGPVKALYGDNTDWIGIRACIRRGLSPANTVRPHSTGLVCGAGGMARAAIYAMISLGVQNILLCNRTVDNARALAEHYNELIRTHGILELSTALAAHTTVTALDSFSVAWPVALRHPTMIVSCIPTQTTDGTPTNFTLPPDWLASRTGGVVVELAYMPIVTPLVRQVQGEGRKGWILMDGLDMLPEQAYAQFELFTGRRAPRRLMRKEVLKHYSEDEYPPHGALNTDSPAES